MFGRSYTGCCFSCEEKQILRRMQFLFFMNMEIVSKFEVIKLGQRIVDL